MEFSRGSRDVVAAPPAGWPTNRGRLLVRVDFGRAIDHATTLIGDRDFRLDRGDHIWHADRIEKRNRKRRAPVWNFGFPGRGRYKLEVIWFESKNRLDRFVRQNPFDKTFRFSPPPPPPEPILLWDHRWSADPDPRWIPGPRSDRKFDRGLFVVRVRCGPGVSGLALRRGGATPRRLVPGDHVLEREFLSRPSTDGSFDAILGSRHPAGGAVELALLGRGLGRVQVWWFASQTLGDAYCSRNPLDRIDYGFVGSTPSVSTPAAPTWLYGTGTPWRTVSNFELDLRRPHRPAQLVANLASPRSGATIYRSGSDRNRCVGNEWDGGVWYSNEPHGAWTASYFPHPVHIEKIGVRSLGAGGGSASYMVVEALGITGGWRRLTGFCDENVNWHRLDGGRTAVSRRPVEIDARNVTALRSLGAVRAVRVCLLGDGPFRAAGLFVTGSAGGQPFAPRHDAPIAHVRVPANGGWIDTGCDVIAGRDVFFDISGGWSIGGPSREYGLVGAEGYPRLALENRLGRSASNYWSRLPANDCPGGSLIGRVGPRGRPFAILPGTPIRCAGGGRLYLACNDVDWRDNSGDLNITVAGVSVPWQAPIESSSPLPGLDVVRIRIRGQVLDRFGRAVADCDVVLQETTAPHLIHGGGRTDYGGNYDLEVTAPRGARVVLRLPSYRTECAPRVFGADGDFAWSPRLP